MHGYPLSVRVSRYGRLAHFSSGATGGVTAGCANVSRREIDAAPDDNARATRSVAAPTLRRPCSSEARESRAEFYATAHSLDASRGHECYWEACQHRESAPQLVRLTSKRRFYSPCGRHAGASATS
jgi:hypothetical protein